ncbi:toxin [Streptomyces sp. NPDC058739]|uniref:toxin n=1 Tax=Streptomyces sp. NPDC058739 TaxID=3346618 RepID=UPI00367582ED
MSSKAMKSLLADLGRRAARTLERPADPRVVMEEFCRAMSVRRGRPIQLVFRAFPEDVPASGLRLDCGDRSVIVVEARAVPEAQLVILGHELWHEEQGGCDHHATGFSAAARTLGSADSPRALHQVAADILAAEEVPRETLLAVAARAASVDEHEADAETFGLIFAREVRTWVKGRYARGPVSPSTVEGRINLSLSNHSGQILG